MKKESIIEYLEKIAWKLMALLPLIFTFFNYFTVLKAEQRNTRLGIIFLIISILYALLLLIFIVTNWNK